MVGGVHPAAPSLLPAQAEGRKQVLRAMTLSARLSLRLQSSPEQVLAGEKERRIEEKQTSFAHTEVHT